MLTMPLSTLLSLLVTAGVLALALLWPRVRTGPPAGRLAGEVFVTTLPLFALAYVLLVVAQRLPW
jgi:hypothetical protein